MINSEEQACVTHAATEPSSMDIHVHAHAHAHT
jgi:hypothetical protein